MLRQEDGNSKTKTKKKTQKNKQTKTSGEKMIVKNNHNSIDYLLSAYYVQVLSYLSYNISHFTEEEMKAYRSEKAEIQDLVVCLLSLGF